MAEQYAVNLADLTCFLGSVPVEFMLKPVLRDYMTADCEPKQIDGTGMVLDCDPERGEAIVYFLRKKYKANQLRIYRRSDGAGRWTKVP